MKTKYLLPNSQKPAINRNSEPNESGLQPQVPIL
jgi:hypothetical protein